MDIWTSCVTSHAVFNAIAHLLNPKFFKKLKDVAKGMNDARLEGVAFKGYFHALVRHHHPFCVKFRRYDDGNCRDYPNWKNIMEEPGVIDCNQFPLNKIKISSAGKNMEECVAEMEEWAGNPSKMFYWTPAISLCETIDAVAKWTLPDRVEECFCFLQLTMATKHKCDENVLWELVQPFVKKKLKVCYIVLTHDKDEIYQFRLDPEQIKKEEVVNNVDLYVAQFEKEKQYGNLWFHTGFRSPKFNM